jgi:uncharacterized membrane protein
MQTINIHTGRSKRAWTSFDLTDKQFAKVERILKVRKISLGKFLEEAMRSRLAASKKRAAAG